MNNKAIKSKQSILFFKASAKLNSVDLGRALKLDYKESQVLAANANRGNKLSTNAAELE